MGQCPFCHAEIPDKIALDGGTCPVCFAEVPGEEAATDPGEERRKAQERRDWLRLSLPGIALASLLVLVLLGAGVGGLVWALQPRPRAPVIDFDAGEFAQPMTIVSYQAPEEAPPGPDGKPAAGGTPGPVTALRPFEVPLGGPTEVASLGSAGEERAAEGKTTKAGVADERAEDLRMVGGGTTAVGGGVALGGPDVSGATATRRWRPGEVLKDEGVIVQHLMDVMGARIPGLTPCYERVLKARPEVAGRWRMDFTVSTEGSVGEIAVTGVDMADAELEACIAGELGQWRFNPMAEDQPVRKTVTFRPSM